MKKKDLYSVHILKSELDQNEFGYVEFWSSFPSYEIKSRIHIKKDTVSEDDSYLFWKLTLEEIDVLSNTLQKGIINMKHLKLLAKRGKLNESAYYDNESLE